MTAGVAAASIRYAMPALIPTSGLAGDGQTTILRRQTRVILGASTGPLIGTSESPRGAWRTSARDNSHGSTTPLDAAVRSNATIAARHYLPMWRSAPTVDLLAARRSGM
jgi:hypothetical protein